MDDDERISAYQALQLVEGGGGGGASYKICRRARDGLITAHARVLLWGQERYEDVAVPKEFWWAGGEAALDQYWEPGDFETWIGNRTHCRAYGVTFLRSEVEAMVPHKIETEETRGGRKRSEQWNDWIVALADQIHNGGIPPGSAAEGQDQLIADIDARLVKRGLEGPARSTVQPVVRAILLRLRQAEN